MDRDQIGWGVVATVSAIAAGWAARQVAQVIWSMFSDVETPVDPADRSASWRDALGWAVLAGIMGGVARVLGRRGASELQARIT